MPGIPVDSRHLLFFTAAGDWMPVDVVFASSVGKGRWGLDDAGDGVVSVASSKVV